MKKGNSIFGGIIAGIILVIGGIGLLWWNEGRTVKTQQGIDEAKSNFIQVKSDKINSKNDNKLIATNGKLDLSDSEELVDEDFNIKVQSAKMERVVEMYQWTESCTTDEDNHENCTYKKEWEDSLVDSSDFKQSNSHTNPSSMPYEGIVYTAENVKMGEFILPESLLKTLSTKKEKKTSELEEEFNNEIEGYNIDGKYITDSSNIDKPEIGDIRVSFKYNDADSVSVLAVQTSDTLTEYTSKNGTKIYRLKEGIHQGDAIIQDLTDENQTLKWILRLVGALLVIFGIASILSPLSKLTGFIPIVGNVVSFATALVSFLLGTAISLIVIAIAWLRFRPLLSIGLLVVVVIIIVILLTLKKKKTKSAE